MMRRLINAETKIASDLIGKARKSASLSVRRFGSSEDGGMIIFSLFLFVSMIIIGGLGIDLMLYEAQRTRLQATTDRAILAAAHPDHHGANAGSDAARKQIVMSYFKTAGLENNIELKNIKVTTAGAAAKISAQASMTVEPMLMHLVGVSGFEAVAQGTAEQSAGLSEVSLVVDVSGSMGSSSNNGTVKLTLLKQAAKKFANIVLCNPSEPDQNTNCTVAPGSASMSLVPYSEQVVAGKDLLSTFNRIDDHEQSYCASYYEDEFRTTSVMAGLKLRQTAKFDARRSAHSSPSSGNHPCKTNSWRTVTPLTSSAKTIGDRLDLLQASGWTSSDIGMRWGVTLLDPSIRTNVTKLITKKVVETAFEGRPYDYHYANGQKVVVLMTDGLNTEQPYLLDGFRSGPSRIWVDPNNSNRIWLEKLNDIDNPNDNTYVEQFDSYRTVTTFETRVCTRSNGYYPSHYYYRCYRWETQPVAAVQLSWEQVWARYTTKWYDNLYTAPNPAVMTGQSAKDKRLNLICTAAKDAGVIIYTIELETPGSTSGAGILKSCASSEGHYYKVDGIDLVATFSSIAKDIARLKLKPFDPT